MGGLNGVAADDGAEQSRQAIAASTGAGVGSLGLPVGLSATVAPGSDGNCSRQQPEDSTPSRAAADVAEKLRQLRVVASAFREQLNSLAHAYDSQVALLTLAERQAARAAETCHEGEGGLSSSATASPRFSTGLNRPASSQSVPEQMMFAEARGQRVLPSQDNFREEPLDATCPETLFDKHGSACEEETALAAPGLDTPAARSTGTPGGWSNVSRGNAKKGTINSRKALGEEVDIALQEVWEGKTRKTLHHQLQTLSSTTFSLRTLGTGTDYSGRKLDNGPLNGGDHTGNDGLCYWLVLWPNGRVHLLWGLLSLLAMFYDLVALPLVAFEGVEDSLTIENLNVATGAFWTADVVVSFISGYHDEGYVELRLSKIARRYLRTWFGFDLLVITVDWVTFILGSGDWGASLARLGKSFRLTRIIRATRLLRIAKILNIIDELTDFVMSETVLVWLNILKLLFGIIFINHFVACLWYWVGRETDSPRWVDALDEIDATVFHRYVVSFHWAMAQYTPAPTNFHAMNMYERLYATCILVIGVALFSSFLGNITSLLTHVRTSIVAQHRHVENVREYLMGNKVPLYLHKRINSFIRKRRCKAPGLVVSEVAYFAQLPETLAMELKVHAFFFPCLKEHPIFLWVERMDHTTFAIDICSDGIVERSLSWGDELFYPGSVAKNMFFAKVGNLLYKSSYEYQGEVMESEKFIGAKSEEVHNGKPCTWICEVVLWCRWTHQGHLEAGEAGIILELNAEVLLEVVQKHPQVFNPLKNYAHEYTERLRCKVKDLKPGSSIDDMFCSLPVAEEIAQLAGMPVQRLRKSASTRSIGWELATAVSSRITRRPSMSANLQI